MGITFWSNLCLISNKNYLYNVKVKKLIFFLTLLMLTVSNTSYASGIKRGYEALLVKDYFRAKKRLLKGMKYNSSPASFGLATIYSRDDNPFYNLDSAYHYILISDSTWDLTKERKKEKWKLFGWTCEGIDSLKLKISSKIFHSVGDINTENAYANFVIMHPWSKEYGSAIYSRDSIAFFGAVLSNSALDYQVFIGKYPESSFIDLAEQNFYNSQFKELTIEGTLASYVSFVNDHPNSPQRSEADEFIYRYITEINTIASYEDFVLNYSANSFSQIAWEEFYQVFLFDYSLERIQLFLETYPQAKNIDQVKSDLNLAMTNFLPFIENGLYGMMNLAGEVVIEPVFQFLSKMEHGLSRFGYNDKVGLINMRGEIQVKADYTSVTDNNYGRYIVEKGDYIGLIDRNGKELLTCKYEDIGMLSEGIVYVSEGENYYYVDYNGNRMNTETYVNISDMNNGLATVETELGKGLLNGEGQYIITPNYSDFNSVSDSIYTFGENGLLGLITFGNDTLMLPSYEYISRFSDGIAMAIRNDSVFYIVPSGEIAFNKSFNIFPNYKLKGEFENGTAIVVIDGKYGRINKYGDIITDVEYENLGKSEKFIPFFKEGKWGILSLTNKILISPLYQTIDVVDQKFAITRLDDSIGVLDVNGNQLIPNSFSSIDYLGNDFFKVFNGEKYGVYKNDFLLIPLEFNRIELFDNHFVSLRKGECIEYLNMDNDQRIKLRGKIE